MKLHVIIYEDNEVYSTSLARVINSNAAYEVVGLFTNCKNTKQEIANLKPDLALMDIQMPESNGLEGLEVIKSIAPQTKVIMFTVFEDNGKIFKAICLGADGYLLKSSTPHQIFEAFKEVQEGGAPLTPSIASKILKLLSKRNAEKPYYQLTQREKEILELLVDGNSYKMIGTLLKISIETVKTHIKNIYEKLQVNSQTEAVSKALKEGIV